MHLHSRNRHGILHRGLSSLVGRLFSPLASAKLNPVQAHKSLISAMQLVLHPGATLGLVPIYACHIIGLILVMLLHKYCRCTAYMGPIVTGNQMYHQTM